MSETDQYPEVQNRRSVNQQQSAIPYLCVPARVLQHISHDDGRNVAVMIAVKKDDIRVYCNVPRRG